MADEKLTTANLPAFPKPQDCNWASGGLTKLELISAMIYSHNINTCVPSDAVDFAKNLIDALDKRKAAVSKSLERDKY